MHGTRHFIFILCLLRFFVAMIGFAAAAGAILSFMFDLVSYPMRPGRTARFGVRGEHIHPRHALREPRGGRWRNSGLQVLLLKCFMAHPQGLFEV